MWARAIWLGLSPFGRFGTNQPWPYAVHRFEQLATRFGVDFFIAHNVWV
jgi:hypothetical protein